MVAIDGRKTDGAAELSNPTMRRAEISLPINERGQKTDMKLAE